MSKPMSRIHGMVRELVDHRTELDGKALSVIRAHLALAGFDNPTDSELKSAACSSGLVVGVSRDHELRFLQGDRVATVQAGQLTPMRAMRRKCLDCSGGSSLAVKQCPVLDCPLFPFRLGHRPKFVDKVGNGRLRGHSRRNTEIVTAESSQGVPTFTPAYEAP